MVIRNNQVDNEDSANSPCVTGMHASYSAKCLEPQEYMPRTQCQMLCALCHRNTCLVHSAKCLVPQEYMPRTQCQIPCATGIHASYTVPNALFHRNTCPVHSAKFLVPQESGTGDELIVTGIKGLGPTSVYQLCIDLYEAIELLTSSATYPLIQQSKRWLQPWTYLSIRSGCWSYRSDLAPNERELADEFCLIGPYPIEV